MGKKLSEIMETDNEITQANKRQTKAERKMSSDADGN